MTERSLEPGIEGDAARPRKLSVGRIAVGAGVVIAVVLMGRQVGAQVPVFARWVEGLGFWGPLVFVTGYALAVVAFVPGSILTLAAGAIFGVLEGTGLVVVAAILGSTGAFLLARHGARAWVERRIEGDPRFAAIDRAIGREGRKIVLLLRLSPVFPFNLLNYALGLTRVRLVDYVIAGIGMLPGTLLYVYSGKVAGDVAAVASGVEMEHGPGYYGVLGTGLLATLGVTLFVTRLARAGLMGAPLPQAARGEGALMARLSPDDHAARIWAEAQARLSARARTGRAVNLDPAALVMDMVLELAQLPPAQASLTKA